jgi:hypothetical protein
MCKKISTLNLESSLSVAKIFTEELFRYIEQEWLKKHQNVSPIFYFGVKYNARFSSGLGQTSETYE